MNDEQKITVRMTATRPGPDGVVLDVDTDHTLPASVAEMLIVNNWANAHPVVEPSVSAVDQSLPSPPDPAETEAHQDEPGPDKPAAKRAPAKRQARTKQAPKTKG